MAIELIRDPIERLMYIDWLVGSVNVMEDRDYSDLLYMLSEIEFYPLINYDEDRGDDGIALRELWASVTNIRSDLDFGGASVLEVLIGIAKRIEFQLFGSHYIDEWDYVKVFWDMIWNLGLEEFFGTLSCDTFEQIDRIVTLWLNREYFRHKKGNIFIIMNDPRNMRKLNIWTQMTLYIREKWPK